MIGAYKPFDQEVHDACDPPSRMVVKRWVESHWNVKADDFEKYKVDLVCSRDGINVGYIEIEVRQWFCGFPIMYSTIHIPSRKAKLFNNDLPTIYFVVSGDFKHGLWINTDEILKHEQIEVRNTAIAEGEYFYDVPTDKFKYVFFDDRSFKEKA
jgi:hypothetical protein